MKYKLNSSRKIHPKKKQTKYGHYKKFSKIKRKKKAMTEKNFSLEQIVARWLKSKPSQYKKIADEVAEHKMGRQFLKKIIKLNALKALRYNLQTEKAVSTSVLKKFKEHFCQLSDYKKYSEFIKTLENHFVPKKIIDSFFCFLISPNRNKGNKYFEVSFNIHLMIGKNKVWSTTTETYHVIRIKLQLETSYQVTIEGNINYLHLPYFSEFDSKVKRALRSWKKFEPDPSWRHKQKLFFAKTTDENIRFLETYTGSHRIRYHDDTAKFTFPKPDTVFSLTSGCPSGAKQFYEFMLKAPKQTGMILFRGDDSVNGAKVGDVVPRPYFTSTSFHPVVAATFTETGHLLEIDLGTDVPVLDVREKSRYTDEFEILVPPCYFKIVGIERYKQVGDWFSKKGVDECLTSYYKNKIGNYPSVTVFKVKPIKAKSIQFTENTVTLGGW